MQSTDRKFSLKYIHNDQCGRLQQRYQNEAQLLEDLRLFMKQKHLIEKAYGQSLVKLSQQFSAKIPQLILAKDHRVPGEHNDSILLTDAWKSYLGKAEEAGRIRVQSSETYLNDISESCKHLRTHRTQVAKLAFDFLAEMQKEALQSTQDVSKSQKIYKEKFQKTKECQLKLRGVQTRLRTSSNAKAHNQNVQVSEEMVSCEAKSDLARNDFLLSLASCNEHLKEYYKCQLPGIIQLIDGEMCGDWRRFLLLASETERKACHGIMRCCDDTNLSSDKISRKHDVHCFLEDHPCLSSIIQNNFMPHNGDEISRIVVTHLTRPDLETEARKCTLQVAREEKVAEKCQGELEKMSLEDMTIEDRTRHYEAYFNLKRVIFNSKLKREKARARLNILLAGGVVASSQSGDSGATQRTDEGDGDSFNSNPTEDAASIDQEVGGSSKNLSDRQSVAYPYLCRVLYDYVAVNPDELNFKVGEELKVVGEGSGDGWIWAENGVGDVGLVPENYITTVKESSAGLVNILRSAPPPPDKNSEGPEVCEQPVVKVSNENKVVNLVKLADKDVFWVRALYDYEGTSEEELTFSEGQLIKVVRTSRDVDDGWWEGEVKGATGIFPSMIVEEVFVVTPSKQSGHKNVKSLTDANWKSSVNLSLPHAVRDKCSATCLEEDNNSNNNNNKFLYTTEEAAITREHHNLCEGEDMQQSCMNSHSTQARNVDCKIPMLTKCSEDSYIVQSMEGSCKISLGMTTNNPPAVFSTNYRDNPEYTFPSPLRSEKYFSPNMTKPISSYYAACGQPPSNRSSAINHQRRKNRHMVDSSTLPRSRKNQSPVDRKPTTEPNPAIIRSETRGSSFEMRSNFLGFPQSKTNHKNVDYNYKLYKAIGDTCSVLADNVYDTTPLHYPPYRETSVNVSKDETIHPNWMVDEPRESYI